MKAGDVVLVKFPFANLETAKKRPALVLGAVEVSRRGRLVTIAMITSRTEGIRIEGDVLLEEWESARLLHPSLVRLSKVATVDGELIERTLGTLLNGDRARVARAFGKLFRGWMSPN